MLAILKFAALSAVSTVLIYFGLAFGLLFSQDLSPLENQETLSFDGLPGTTEQAAVPLSRYTARDDISLGVRYLPGETEEAPLVIILHGSGWHGGAYTGIAHYLADKGDFEILVPDLRGHGPEPLTRGDVAYIGQFEDDLADLIKIHRKPDQKVVMIGHSSGGGLVIRFAGGQYGSMLDKAILMAPFLKYNAPTVRENSGGWVTALTRRLIGLSMLNSIGITAFNDRTVLQFNFPRSVLEGSEGKTATRQYSYRLNTSFAPRDAYLEDIAELPEFLLIAGTEDDAFYAEEFEPVMASANGKGQYLILPGVDHLGLINNKEAMRAIFSYLQE